MRWPVRPPCRSTPCSPKDPSNAPAARGGQILVTEVVRLLAEAGGGHLFRPIGTLRVRGGGWEPVTDWALRHVIEPAFPVMLAYNERPTADDVVRIEVRAHDNPFVAGVMDGRDDPQWWLEGSSYPVRVLDPRVSVLITSTELEAKYGEAAVAVTFPWGEGEVFHMISHYYLQRTELRTARHAQSATAFTAEKGVAVPAAMLRMLANLVADKKRKQGRPKEGR